MDRCFSPSLFSSLPFTLKTNKQTKTAEIVGPAFSMAYQWTDSLVVPLCAAPPAPKNPYLLSLLDMQRPWITLITLGWNLQSKTPTRRTILTVSVEMEPHGCLLYTSDAADETSTV